MGERGWNVFRAGLASGACLTFSLIGGVATTQTRIPKMPVCTSEAFLPWAYAYVAECVASAPLARPTTVYFSPDGDDVLGDGSEARPFQSVDKANQVISQSAGHIRVRFQEGGVFRSRVGLVVDRPWVTVDSYAPAGISSFPKPLLTRFEAPVSPSDWRIESTAGLFSTPVAEPVAWAKYQGDTDTVFRMMTTLQECRDTQGSWIQVGNRLYVHSFEDINLTDSDRRVEYVFKNTESGVNVLDRPGVRLHRLQVEGFGAGTPGDHSYTGYGIQLNQTGSNRGVVTECEAYYNGRHSITKIGSGAGGSFVLVGCRTGWLVNDGINAVCYTSEGQQEFISAFNEFLGGELPVGNAPYAYAGSSAPEYLHTADDSRYCHSLYLSLEDRIVPGQYQNGDLPGSNCAPSFSDLSACRSFVVRLSAPARSPSALDATKPSANHSNGLLYYRLGNADHVYLGSKVSPTMLWTYGAGDVALAASSHGLWINCELSLDFSPIAQAASNPVLSVSPTSPQFESFDSSFYACQIEFRASGGGATMGFSGPMIHRYGSYYGDIRAAWGGQMHASLVDATSTGTGEFLLGFGNRADQLDDNAYYSLSREDGAWGCDQDPHRHPGSRPATRPAFGASLRSAGPILVRGHVLETDMEGNRRPAWPTVGPRESLFSLPIGKPK